MRGLKRAAILSAKIETGHISDRECAPRCEGVRELVLPPVARVVSRSRRPTHSRESLSMAFWTFLYIANILQIFVFSLRWLLSTFQNICLGCCTVAAHRARSAGLESAT